MPNPGFVYLLKPENMPYKIGYAAEVKKRVKTILPTLPFQAEIVHTIPASDARRAERHLHQRFAARRLSGEWFALTEEDVAWIRTLTRLDIEPPPPKDPRVQIIRGKIAHSFSPDDLLSSRQAALIIGRSQREVQRLCKEGLLPHLDVDGRPIIRVRDAEAYQARAAHRPKSG